MNIRIVHVVEPLAGGMVSFLLPLVRNLNTDSHLIIHGPREANVSLHQVKKRFHGTNANFIFWRSAVRELNFYRDLKAFWELFIILKRLRNEGAVDVVHLHSSKAGFLGRLVCRLLGIQNKVVYTPNGVPFNISKNKCVNSFYTALEQAASHFGGRVVSCSSSEKTEFNKRGIKSVQISNGVQNELKRKSVRSSSKCFKIVTVGRIADQKNPFLFNQIASYFSGFNHFQFFWVGDGEKRQVLTSENITVTGWQDYRVVNTYLEKADLYLSTANYEGLPFSVLEALSMNKPVLLSECTGNRDLVFEGLNGDIFKTENEAIWKITKYYNNPAMLKLMGQYSSFYYKSHFLAKETSKKYGLLYEHIVDRHDHNS